MLCALTQVIGIPSRLVFASNPVAKYGHVVVEVYLEGGWLTIDQSLDFFFLAGGRPERASRIYRTARGRRVFGPLYAEQCERLKDVLGEEILRGSFNMALAPEPLDGFLAIGYHNHFVR